MTVDVILPVHNGERWIEEAIASVQTQTYPDWQLTVLDDVSTDGTWPLLQTRYGAFPEKISLVQLPVKHRAVGARMVAMRRVHGSYLAFLDADDRWHPDKLKLQVERMQQEPRVDAVHTDVVHIDEEGRELRGSADRENIRRADIGYEGRSARELSRDLFLRNSIRLTSVLVSRDSFDRAGGFDASLFGGEDWEFWVRFAARGFRIGHLARPLVERRLHGTNVSRAFHEERKQGKISALEKTIRAFPELAELAEARRNSVMKATR